MKKRLVVLSLGGSIVVPDTIDTAFLKRFVFFIKRNVRQSRFIIVVGGGKTCRQYQKALSKVAAVSPEKLDWMGIYTTRVNARLVQLALGKLAHPDIVKDPTKVMKFTAPVLVASGYKPGWSTDYDAVLLAKLHRAEEVVNLFDVDYVYARDPKKFKTAKFFKQLSWKKYFGIIGTVRKPGSHAPFDPVAARAAQKLGVKVIIANGRNLTNLQSILDGGIFKGTFIS
ncbi:MAG: UMP kinase [Patescibacteria group bacterium]|nr:UMP kinase [Patescibacteria group bacterium]